METTIKTPEIRLNAEVINVGTTVLSLNNEKQTKYTMSTMKLSNGKLVSVAIYDKVTKPTIGSTVTIEAKPTPSGEAWFSLLPIIVTERVNFDSLIGL